MTTKTRQPNGSTKPYRRTSDNLWCVVLELPSMGGKRRRKTLTHRTQAGVIAKARKVRAELDRAGDLPTSSPTLAVWLKTWLARDVRPHRRPRTHEGYATAVNQYIVPAIGNVKLDKLTPTHVRRVHDYVTEDKGLSSTTAQKAHRVLTTALNAAYNQGRVMRNVATMVEAPPAELAERPALTAPQSRNLIAAADDDLEAALFLAYLASGGRRGEVLALTTDNLDLDADVPMIVFAWQLQRLTFEHGCGKAGEAWVCGRSRAGACPDRHVPMPANMEARQVHGGLFLTRPKTRSSWRRVPVPEVAVVQFRRYLAAHPVTNPHGLIFTGANGNPLDPRRVTAAWKAACARAGLDPDVVLHSSRHTYATLLEAVGASPQNRREMIGHTRDRMTEHYTHPSDASKAADTAKVGALLSPVE